MTCAWRGMDAYFGKVMSNEISPDDAPAKMQAEADACVRRHGDRHAYPDPTPTP